MRPVTLYAGLAVMLMRQQRNVLPIKYLYRKGGQQNEGFSFEPRMTGREDKDYVKSAIYSELIYNMDSTAARHTNRIGIGKIPGTWKLQRKGGKRIGGGSVYGGKPKIYHRGQHTASATPKAYTYENYGYFKGDKTYTSGEWGPSERYPKGRTGKYRYGRGGVTTPAKDPQDLMRGGNIPHPSTLAVVDKFLKFQASKTSKLSNRQVSPKGMKARWIRGGGGKSQGGQSGGQHLRDLKLPNKQSLITGMFEGEVDKLPKNHIMHHWYKLWEHNYDMYLRNQAQRVLVSFLRAMGKSDEAKALKSKTTLDGKLVKPTKGRQSRGKARKTRQYSTATLIKRYTKTPNVGLAGVVSPETVLNTISDGGLHVIGSNKTESRIEDMFTKLSAGSKQDLNQFINDVSQLQREINSDPLKLNRVPKQNRVIGVFLGNYLGLIIVGRPGKSDSAPVKLTPTVLLTGRREAQVLAASLLRKEKKRKATVNLKRISKTSLAAKENLKVIQNEMEATYALIGKNMGMQLSIEGESGIGVPIDRDFANLLKKRMTKNIKGHLSGAEAELNRIFDPYDTPEKTSNFMEWYERWMLESTKLERRTVEMQRPHWQRFMLDWVGPKTDKYRQGKVSSYRSAARTWHSPGYIRPFVMTDVPKDSPIKQQKPF